MRTILLLFITAFIAGCQKYATLQPVSGAAYVRVLNSITNYDSKDFSHVDLAGTRLLTLFIDSPATVADFMYFRAFDAGPYETRPDQPYANFEYPGTLPVRVGGVINGLDASRWAQIPSGAHRLVLLRRGAGNAVYHTYIQNMTPAQRDTVTMKVLDTTMTFSEGKVYTLEVVNTDPYDGSKLHWYVREETFPAQAFDTTKVYVNFYNMTTDPDVPDALDVYWHMRYVDNCVGPLVFQGLTETPLTYSLDISNSALGYLAYNAPESFLTHITGRNQASAPYMALPMPPPDSFYYHEGPAFGQFRLPFDRPKFVFDFYMPGQNAAGGYEPVTELLADEFNLTALNNVSQDLSPQYWGQTQKPNANTPYLCSPYLTVTSGNVSYPFPLVNTIELLSGYNGLNLPTTGIKAFQIALQRPYPPSFIQ